MKTPRQNLQLKLCSGTQIKFSGMIRTFEAKGNFLPPRIFHTEEL